MLLLSIRRLAGLAAGIALLALSGAARGAESPREFTNPYRVSAEEEALADRLARAELIKRELDTGGRMYLVSAHVGRDKEAELRGEQPRLVATTYYRYDGDLTISAWVDIHRETVIQVDAAAGVPASLSVEEFEHARSLALADDEIAAAVAGHADVEIEALVVRTVSEDDPLFGHRAVRLLLKTPRGYVRRPVVIVDLTAERAFIEPPSISETSGGAR